MRTAYVKNIEPVWVEYGYLVQIPDDVLDHEIEDYAEQACMENEDGIEISWGPEVKAPIEGMDQEFHFQSVEGKKDETLDALGKPLPYGRCDTCGAPCDEQGCTKDRTHEIAIP